MSDFVGPIVTVLTAIIGVAILAVIVSRQSNTAGVIKASSQGFSSALNTALSPITGGGFAVTNNYSGGF